MSAYGYIRIGFLTFIAFFGLIFFAPLAIAQSASPEKTSITIKKPAGQWIMTPYLVGREAVLHFQPKGHNTQADFLVDLKTGQPWRSSLEEFLAGDANRLGFVRRDSSQSVAIGTSARLEQRLAVQLACGVRHQIGCTTLQDGETLVFAGEASGGDLLLETVDLSPLIQFSAQMLAGQVVAKPENLTSELWDLLDLLSEYPDIRDQWDSALASIKTRANFVTAVNNYKNLRLYERKYFATPNLVGRADQAGRLLNTNAIDLRATYETIGFRILLAEMLTRWEGNPASKSVQEEINRLILKGLMPPSQVIVSSHMADVVSQQLQPAQVNRLAQMVFTYGNASESPELQCFSRSLRGLSCLVQPKEEAASGQSPDTDRRSEDRRAPPKSVSGHKPPVSEPSGATPDRAPHATGRRQSNGDEGTPREDSGATQEIVRINQLPNKAVLLTYEESSGQLVKESTSISGLTFTARSLGNISGGRFELQVAQSPNSPVKLAKGRYRAKLVVLLDYVREDRCTGGALTCLMSKIMKHAILRTKTVYFDIGPYNRYTSKSAVSFGSLIPLSADGGGLYESVLKSTRLSIKDVDLQLSYRN